MDSKVTDLTKGVYRRMYAGFIKGQRINQISLQAEAWFWRVVASADDFGNADAEPLLCWTATVGRRVNVTVKQVKAWLKEMEESRLIQMYPGAGNEKYLHINGFEDLQPSGRNGKKVRRFPSFDNPGESRIVQNNPEFQNAPHSDTDTHSDSDSDSHTDTEDKSIVAPATPDATEGEKVSKSRTAQAVEIFEYWKQERARNGQTVFDEKRKRLVMSRLADYSADFIKQAIRGIKHSPHHMGQNDKQQVYDDLSLICRDSKNIETFAALDVGNIPARASPRSVCEQCHGQGVLMVYDAKIDSDVETSCFMCHGEKVKAS